MPKRMHVSARIKRMKICPWSFEYAKSVWLRSRRPRLAWRHANAKPIKSGDATPMINSVGATEPGGLLSTPSACLMIKPRTISPIPNRVS